MIIMPIKNPPIPFGAGDLAQHLGASSERITNLIASIFLVNPLNKGDRKPLGTY
jgi:hypothetical protein